MRIKRNLKPRRPDTYNNEDFDKPDAEEEVHSDADAGLDWDEDDDLDNDDAEEEDDNEDEDEGGDEEDEQAVGHKQGDEADLPELLRDTGPVPQELTQAKARVNQAQSDTAKKLYRQIVENLKSLQRSAHKVRNPVDDLWDAQPKQSMSEVFSETLLRGVPEEEAPFDVDAADGYQPRADDDVSDPFFDHNRFSEDYVLRYCLARLGHLDEVAERLHDLAWIQYTAEVEDYDLVLGGLVPEDLRRRAHSAGAADNFQADASATLAGDAAVFEEILAREEERRKARPVLGVPTGLPTLDAHTGGLHGLSILGGPPCVGKTTLALAAGATAIKADSKVGVVYYSFDMDKVPLMKRLLSSESGVPYVRLTAPDKIEEERQAIHQALGRLNKQVFPRMRILGRRPTESPEPLAASTIAKECDALREETGAERVLVVFDYLRLMPVPEKLHSELDRDHYRLDQLHDFQRASRTLAEPGGDVVLALSEVRKGRADEDGLILEDLMGSARLGYSADLVLLLNPIDRHPIGAGTARLNLEIAKGRDGVEWARIDLDFFYTISRFAEAAAAPPKKISRSAKQTAATQPTSQQTASKGRKPDPLAGL